MVPVGVNDQDWLATPPAAEVQVTVKSLVTRDCSAVGVHVRFVPLIVAPPGPCRVKLTALPAGSLTASVYEYVLPSCAAKGGLLLNAGLSIVTVTARLAVLVVSALSL